MKKPGNKYEKSEPNKTLLAKVDNTDSYVKKSNKSFKLSHIRNIFEIPVEYREKQELIVPDVNINNGSLRLEGIFLGDHRFAVINGKVYSVGDKVAGQEIQKIEMKKVLFKNGNSLKVDQ